MRDYFTFNFFKFILKILNQKLKIKIVTIIFSLKYVCKLKKNPISLHLRKVKAVILEDKASI